MDLTTPNQLLIYSPPFIKATHHWSLYKGLSVVMSPNLKVVHLFSWLLYLGLLPNGCVHDIPFFFFVCFGVIKLGQLGLKNLVYIDCQEKKKKQNRTLYTYTHRQLPCNIKETQTSSNPLVSMPTQSQRLFPTTWTCGLFYIPFTRFPLHFFNLSFTLAAF